MLAESRYWYAYELPPALIPAFWGGRWRGQSQKWFAFAFTGSDADINVASDRAEFSAWRWATPAEVLRLIVDFKRPVYEAVFEELCPLLHAGSP